MEKLVPQNEKQEHLVQILLAKLQGFAVEYDNNKGKGEPDWRPATSASLNYVTSVYRIKPKDFEVPQAVWDALNPTYTVIAINKVGQAIVSSTDNLVIDEAGVTWVPDNEEDLVINMHDLLAINLDGVDWTTAIARRPNKGVSNE